jgi:monoamine oxidase
MAALVEALAVSLPPMRVHCEHKLRSVRRLAEGVELRFDCAGASKVVSARRVVIALPPRLIAEQLRFEPALPDTLLDALRAAPTWMATQAKAVLVYERAVWRDAGHSGNAFAQYEQAVLGETFDACEPEHGLAAVGAFLALDPQTRKSFRAGLPLLLRSQMTMLFGPELRDLEQHVRDWSLEPFTCSELDLREHDMDSEQRASPVELQSSHWGHRLYFGGSETAEVEPGYLEGALHAAARILHALNTSVT